MLGKLFGSSEAGKGLVFIFSGIILAQLVTFLTMPIISRLYSPEAFGAYSLVVSLAAIASPAVGLKMETATMLPKEDHEVPALAWLGILGTVTLSLLYGIGIWLWTLSSPDSAAASVPGIPLFVGLLAAVTAIYGLANQLALRDRRYTLVAQRPLVQSIGISGSQLLLSLATRTPFALNLGDLIGRCAGIALLLRKTKHYFARTTSQEMRAAARKFWRFPLVFAPSGVLNSLGLQAPLVFVSLWFGLGAAGQLGMAERIVAIPIALISASVGQIIDAEISKNIRDRDPRFRETFLRLSLALGGVALIAGVAFALLGAIVVSWFLGEGWHTAGQFVQILGVAVAIRLVSSPLSRLIDLFQKALANTVLDIIRVALMGIAIVIVMTATLPIASALWFIYGSIAVTHVITWCYVFFLIRRESNLILESANTETNNSV